MREDKDSVPDSNSKISLLVNDKDMILGSEEGNNNDLKLTAKQQELYEYFGERQEEEQAERQEKQAP